MAVKEIICFGPAQRLVGVLTGPASEGPILLLPSAGLQPRAGPFRLHTQLAERLSARGIRSFRYDVPGVGEAPRLNGCNAQQATLAAIDHLEATQGCRSFAVGGICSAADTGWDVANVDSRVSAVLLLDGLCWTGPWYRYGRAIDLLRRLPRDWRRMLHSAQRGLRGDDNGLDGSAYRTWPSHAQARHQFAQLVERDVRMLWIFSGGYTDRFLHPRQFAWTFGAPARDRRVTMHYWPDCDHTYYFRRHRDRLIDTIEQWLLDTFMPASSAALRPAEHASPERATTVPVPATVSRSPLYAPSALQRPLRVSLVGPGTLPAWLVDFVELTSANAWLDLVVLPVADARLAPPPAVPADLRALLAYEGHRRTTAAAFGQSEIRHRDGIVIEPAIEPGTPIGQVRQTVAASRPDLVLLLGLDHLADDLQDVGRIGCWSLDANLTDAACAAQALLAPVRRGEAATPFGLELLQAGRPPALLADSWGATGRAAVVVQRQQVFGKMPALLLRALRQLTTRAIPAQRSPAARLRLVPAPGYVGLGCASAALVSTTAYRILARWQQRFRKLDAPWFVLVRHAAAPLDPENPQIHGVSVLHPPDRCGWADPCIVSDGSRHLLFVEQWTATDAKGVIECVQLLEQGQVRPIGRVLDLPVHLSFPQVFQSDGDWYMTVESGQARCVTLYRAASFPQRWQPASTLLSGWPCTDPALHFHQGHWYLFVSIAESGSGTCEDLFVFVAQRLTGPFLPHPANPVVSDVRRARMAGRLFQHQGRLIRPGQDCAPSYGAAIAFNEVLELSPTGYRERQLGRLDASWAPTTDGCHTYSAVDGVEVMDARCVPRVDPADEEFAKGLSPMAATGAVTIDTVAFDRMDAR